MKGVTSIQAVVILIAAFLFWSDTHAQCTECVCGTDWTCSASDCNNNLTQGCTRVEFTAQCSGTHSFSVWSSCTSTPCSNCWPCVNLFAVSGGNETHVANCHVQDCFNGDCDRVCQVNLQQGRTYALYVCKIPCPDESCATCKSDCAVVGCISYGVTSCAP